MARTTASFAPEDAVGGGSVPDGDYTVKEATTDLFTYNGQVPEGVPAVMFLLRADDGTEYEQPYKAGDNEHLTPSDDKTHFVHPNGRDVPNIYKGGAAHQLFSSLVKAGFPKDKLADGTVTVFKGLKATFTNVAAPTGKTKDDNKAGKTIPLVSKIISMPGKGTAGAKPAPARAASPAKATPAPAEANGEPSDLDLMTIAEIQKVLANREGGTCNTGLKLGTAVMQLVAGYRKSEDEGEKAAFKQLANIQRTAKDIEWLRANSELGGWTVGADDVTLNS